MTAEIRILSPGLACSIQDTGRLGFAGFGVPRSGAADPVALHLGNALVGNEADMAGLEFRFVGPKILMQKGIGLIGIAGDMRGTHVQKSTGETRNITAWQSVLLQEGDTVHITGFDSGATGYLTFGGGIELNNVLGSQSTYARAKLGGVNGQNLDAGDVLSMKEAASSSAVEKIITKPIMKSNQPFRIIAGPQDDFFDTETLDRLTNTSITVSSDVDRMGIRLTDVSLPAKADKGHDLISDGLIPGAIQVPGSGEPIILFVDCQSVGGYPKIATIISSDMYRLGQLMPNDKVKFDIVDLTTANLARANLAKQIEASVASIQEYFGEGAMNIKALYQNNLVSGTVDANQPSHFPGNLY